MNSKAALITGSSRGIGASIASEFALAGYTVIVNYVEQEDAAAGVVDKIIKSGGKARAVKADVSDPSSVKKLVQDIKQNEKRIDVLVNNAAIIRNRTVSRMSDADWDDVIRNDLSGPFYLMRESSRVMMKQRSGSIINITSILGLRGLEGTSNYASAKAGLISLTKTAAKELGRFNVKVNAVLPGFHLTDMGSAAQEKYLEQVKNESVLGMTTDIDELSRFIVLLSQMNTISGQVFNWDSRVV